MGLDSKTVDSYSNDGVIRMRFIEWLQNYDIGLDHKLTNGWLQSLEEEE